jgi:peptidoglycan/LPS O-acetylase OafA/YrhL
VAEQKYFHLLSAIRGIAAVLVVFRHTGGLFAPIGNPVSYLAVDMFFLLSGVVLEASYGQRLRGSLSRLRFVWIRWLRIYPLYILGSGISLALLLLTPWHSLTMGGSPWSVGNPLVTWPLAMALIPSMQPGLFEFPFDHPSWSLMFELAVNVFYALVAGFLADWLLALIILGCGVWLLHGLLYFNVIHLVEMGWLQPTLQYGFARAGWSFFLGVAVYRLYLRFPLGFLTRHSGAVSLAVLLLVLALLGGPVPKPVRLDDYILCLTLLFPALIFAALHVRPGAFTGRVYDFLGDVSYPIYTLHVPMFFLLCAATRNGPPAFVWQYAPWPGFVFLAVLIGIGYAAHRYVDMPLQKALRWLGSRRRAPARGAPQQA